MIEKGFAERVVCQSLFVPSYDVEVLEVFDPAVNKWEGILHVAGATASRRPDRGHRR